MTLLHLEIYVDSVEHGGFEEFFISLLTIDRTVRSPATLFLDKYAYFKTGLLDFLLLFTRKSYPAIVNKDYFFNKA